MNSFFVPQLGSQIYTMAGMVTRLHLQADHPGTYRGLSAKYSGDGFADMRFNVDAVPAESFAQWVAATRSAGPVLDAAELCRSGQAEQGGCAFHLSRRRSRSVRRHRELRNAAGPPIAAHPLASQRAEQ